MRARQQLIDSLHARAARHHQAGELAEAEQAYRDVLAQAPDHADSLHGMGVLAHGLGQADLAIGYIGKALQLKPRQAHYHINLGRALRDRGHREEARAAFHMAVLLAPGDAVAQFNLGVVLAELDRKDEALDCYRAALRIDPVFADACANLGLLLLSTGRLRDAETCFQRLRDLRPEDAGAAAIHGAVLRRLGKPEQALVALERALALAPAQVERLNMLGATLLELHRPEEASAALRQALQLDPTHAASHSNLGLALLAAGQPVSAVAALESAAHLRPGDADILANLGTALQDASRPADAAERFRAALDAAPEHAAAHVNLAALQLAAGDFEAGWAGLAWRHRLPGALPRDFGRPRWTGEPLGDGVLLVHAEQGFGDTLQFCRYAILAAQRARVVLEVPRPLTRLLASLPGVARVVAQGDTLPHVDAEIPLLDLPGLFGTRLDSVPAPVPYLSAPPSLIWQARMQELPGLRVGLCWAGNAGYSHDRWRSVPIDALARALRGLDGVSFVSLQKNPPDPPPAFLQLRDRTEEFADFGDTAAIISQLDLVISVDTAVAHLAGALGRPVWLLNRQQADWRWLREREDSPWYPSLRQFRQTRHGDWTDVLARLRVAMEEMLRNRAI